MPIRAFPSLPKPMAFSGRSMRQPHSRVGFDDICGSAAGPRPAPVGTPPFLTLFITSTCNLTCPHCFYWRELNQKDDLSFDEIAKLSESLDPIENLNLSGGEPFLRKTRGRSSACS